MPIPTPPVYPNPLASGSNKIGASLGLNGTSQYVTLGQPSALTSVLQPNHEFTILVRTARNASASTGVIIGQADSTNTTFEIQSLGGSAATCTVGGNSVSTISGSIKEPTWNCIGLINRNAGTHFATRAILDYSTSTAEISAGSQVSEKDIIIGARRNSSNTDSKSWYAGNIGCIAIWNYAMTDAQIQYAMGYITPTENLFGLYGVSNGLIAYYPCNETSGSTLHDCVSGNNGTCTDTSCFTTVQHPKYPVVMIGDSLTVGTGSESNQSPISQVISGGSGTRHMRSAYPYGFGGQNSAYVLSQVQLPAFAPFLNWTQVYLIGAHDYGFNSNVTSALATMIGMLPHNRYIVMGQRIYAESAVASGIGSPSLSGIGDYGTTIRSEIDSMNNAQRRIYGNRYFDSQNNVVALAPSYNNDVFQRRTPYNVAYDMTHMLDEGYVPQSQGVEALLNKFGW